jgi:hypothetical protein
LFELLRRPPIIFHRFSYVKDIKNIGGAQAEFKLNLGNLLKFKLKVGERIVIQIIIDKKERIDGKVF